MIEIKCTQEEKECLMDILVYSEANCFLPYTVCSARKSCEECLEKNIKWNVTDEKGDVRL